MIDLLICGWNISCHARNLFHQLNEPKYPAEHIELCSFIESQQIETPEYCKWQDLPRQPRKRNEF